MFQFMTWLRWKRALATIAAIQENALTVVYKYDIDGFKAYNGWLENILSRYCVQLSVNFDGRQVKSAKRCIPVL